MIDFLVMLSDSLIDICKIGALICIKNLHAIIIITSVFIVIVNHHHSTVLILRATLTNKASIRRFC